MTRGERKRLLREATRQRVRAERGALGEGGNLDLNTVRIEERQAIELLAEVPSVFAFAERLNPNYRRPTWADQRYGAK